jgi:hypothetical protein
MFGGLHGAERGRDRIGFPFSHLPLSCLFRVGPFPLSTPIPLPALCAITLAPAVFAGVPLVIPSRAREPGGRRAAIGHAVVKCVRMGRSTPGPN